MQITALTLDDLLNSVFQKLLKRPFNIDTSRGITSEINSVLIKLQNPRARLSRTETKGKAFSALGELLWYFSKKNDLNFICHYIKDYVQNSEDGKTVYGGYGPRFFRFRGKLDQVKNVIKLLRKRPNTRRAVIQLYDAIDIVEKHVEIPCTCTLQFMIRDKKLHLFTSMRSNDAFIGLPHDIFAFTMIQEILARTLKVGLGDYSHAVGSLHLYQRNAKKAQQYLDEGFQSTNISMPPMPLGNPWPSLKFLLQEEASIRLNEPTKSSTGKIDPYWADLVRLLKIHSLAKTYHYAKIVSIKKQMSSTIYNSYIDGKIQSSKRRTQK